MKPMIGGEGVIVILYLGNRTDMDHGTARCTVQPVQVRTLSDLEPSESGQVK